MTAAGAATLQGYLDIKTPAKTKGLLGKWKVWKRRWVTVDLSTEVSKDASPVSISVHTSQAAAGLQQKMLFSVPLSPQNTVIFRSKSRTHQYAFSIVQNQKAVLHLAGNSETQSQQWMAELRETLWPADPLIQTEKVLSAAYDVSIVDTQRSSEAGVLGVYGYISVRNNVLIIRHPHTGRVAMEWPLSLLDSVHCVDQAQEEDKGKVLSIVSSWEAAGQQQQEVMFYSQNTGDILREVNKALIAYDCKTHRTVSNCDILLRELDANTSSTQHESTVLQESLSPNALEKNTLCTCDETQNREDQLDTQPVSRTIHRKKVGHERMKRRRSQSDTHLNIRSNVLTTSWRQDIKTQAQFYQPVISVPDVKNVDLNIQKEDNPSDPEKRGLLALMFNKNELTSPQDDFFNTSVSSSSSYSRPQSDSLCEDSDNDSSDSYTSPASITSEGFFTIHSCDTAFDEEKEENQKPFLSFNCPSLTETDSRVEQPQSEANTYTKATSRRSSEASISSSHTYSTITAPSSKRPSQLSETLYEDVEKIRSQNAKNKVEVSEPSSPPVLPPRPNSLQIVPCFDNSYGWNFESQSTLSHSSTYSSQDSAAEQDYNRLWELSTSITEALSKVELSPMPTEQKRWYKKVFVSKKRLKRISKSPVNHEEGFLHFSKESNTLASPSPIINVSSNLPNSNYRKNELHRSYSEVIFSSNSDSPLSPFVPRSWTANVPENSTYKVRHGSGNGLRNIYTQTETSTSEMSDLSQCSLNEQLLNNRDIQCMLSARDRHKHFKCWMDSGKVCLAQCEVKEESYPQEDSPYMASMEVFPASNTDLDRVEDVPPYNVLCQGSSTKSSEDYTSMSPQDLCMANDSRAEIELCNEENTTRSLISNTVSLSSNLEDRSGYMLMEGKKC